MSAGSIRPGSNRSSSLRVRRPTRHELSASHRPRNPSTSRVSSASDPIREGCSISILPGSVSREVQKEGEGCPGKAVSQVQASGSRGRRANQPRRDGEPASFDASAARIDADSTPAMSCAEGWARNRISQTAAWRSRWTDRTAWQPTAVSARARHQSRRSSRNTRRSSTRISPVP